MWEFFNFLTKELYNIYFTGFCRFLLPFSRKHHIALTWKVLIEPNMHIGIVAERYNL